MAVEAKQCEAVLNFPQGSPVGSLHGSHRGNLSFDGDSKIW